jgi:hypothetical protein
MIATSCAFGTLPLPLAHAPATIRKEVDQEQYGATEAAGGICRKAGTNRKLVKKYLVVPTVGFGWKTQCPAVTINLGRSTEAEQMKFPFVFGSWKKSLPAARHGNDNVALSGKTRDVVKNAPVELVAEGLTSEFADTPTL